MRRTSLLHDRTPAPRRTLAVSILALALVATACSAGGTASSASDGTIQPTASAPASAAPSVSLIKRSQPCFGPCPAGTHRSARFLPPLTYTVPDGWVTGDQPTEYVFKIGSDTSNDGIFLFRDPLAHSQASDCPATADRTVGTSPKELTAWIASLPGLDATTPKAVTVGGLPGYTLDIRLAPSWKHACPYSDGEPVVPLIVGSGPNNGLDWGVGATGMRIWVLDAGADRRVWIDMEAGDRLTFDQLVQRATPVFDSFEFSAP